MNAWQQGQRYPCLRPHLKGDLQMDWHIAGPSLPFSPGHPTWHFVPEPSGQGMPQSAGPWWSCHLTSMSQSQVPQLQRIHEEAAPRQRAVLTALSPRFSFYTEDTPAFPVLCVKDTGRLIFLSGIFLSFEGASPMTVVWIIHRTQRGSHKDSPSLFALMLSVLPTTQKFNLTFHWLLGILSMKAMRLMKKNGLSALHAQRSRLAAVTVQTPP